MTLLIAERALRDRRRGVVGWSIGIALYVGLMTIFYPTVHDSAMQRAIRSYPKEIQAFFGGTRSFDFSTGAGYLNVELFSLVVPALLVIVAVGYGASALAGELEAGTLDLLLANPVTRGRVVLEKVAGLAVIVVTLAAVVVGSILLVGEFVDLNVPIDRVVIAALGASLLAFLIGVIAMVVGVATGRRSVAIGAAAVVFVGGYLIVGLASFVSWLEPLQVVSPLYHANGTNPLLNGLPVANYLVLFVACAVSVVVTVVVFDRRDLAR
jgi:ABC-2 type transport system permease protein